MKQIKPQYNCSLELAMELVGGKWKLVLLWHLLSGTKRFSEIKRKLGDITQKMLTLQLRELEAAGLLTRTVYPVIPPHVEYSLTERGMELAPVLRGLCAWSGNTPWRRALRLPRCRPLGTERICPARRNLSRKLDFWDKDG